MTPLFNVMTSAEWPLGWFFSAINQAIFQIHPLIWRFPVNDNYGIWSVNCYRLAVLSRTGQALPRDGLHLWPSQIGRNFLTTTRCQQQTDEFFARSGHWILPSGYFPIPPNMQTGFDKHICKLLGKISVFTCLWDNDVSHSNLDLWRNFRIVEKKTIPFELIFALLLEWFRQLSWLLAGRVPAGFFNMGLKKWIPWVAQVVHCCIQSRWICLGWLGLRRVFGLWLFWRISATYKSLRLFRFFANH